MDRVAVTLCKDGDKDGPAGWPKSVVQYNPQVVDKIPEADKDMDLDEYQHYCVGMRSKFNLWESQAKADVSVPKARPQQILPLVDPEEELAAERAAKAEHKKKKHK